MEGVASHHGPVSCAGGGNAAREASIGVRIGQLLSSEITTLGVPTGCQVGKAMRAVASDASGGPTHGVEDPGMCGNSMSENREIPVAPQGLVALGRSEKALGRNPDMHAAGKSDIGVVPGTCRTKPGTARSASTAELGTRPQPKGRGR